MRCDPTLFNVFQWAREGRLPNIRRLMEQGAWGYSIPTFPSHTPTNFATLLTGTLPEVHGIADGPMHVEGNPLARPSLGGFSSTSRKVPAVWSLLEQAGKDVVLLSVPGSTPPELKRGGVVVRGRWGGWGADFNSVIFEQARLEQKKKLSRGAKLFFLQEDLTQFIEPDAAGGWSPEVTSYSPARVIRMPLYGLVFYGLIVDGTDDGQTNYDTILFSDQAGGEGFARLEPQQWSDWHPVTFQWKELPVPSHVRVNVIRLEPDGFFRIRVLVDNLNPFIAEPGTAAEGLERSVGPMVDFVDNYPPQLIYYGEDKRTFLEEARMSLEWHRKAVDAVYRLFDPDVFVHTIYTPNQMLTSRWWLGYLDPDSRRYKDVEELERKELMEEVLEMYKGIDEIVGRALANGDERTLMVLSSDHGAAPLNRAVHLNNFFASRGWLKFKLNPDSGQPEIDWPNTRVVYLKMAHVYIRPDGLGGNWTRGSGEAYERLRTEVADALRSLKDENGSAPVASVVRWEDVQQFLSLPADRVGDLVIANDAGYGWDEEITDDGRIFEVPLKSGYKQAILAKEHPALWTPFIIAGPGVKNNYEIGHPIQMIDQLPTILRLLGEEVPAYVQGKVIEEILE